MGRLPKRRFPLYVSRMPRSSAAQGQRAASLPLPAIAVALVAIVAATFLLGGFSDADTDAGVAGQMAGDGEISAKAQAVFEQWRKNVDELRQKPMQEAVEDISKNPEKATPIVFGLLILVALAMICGCFESSPEEELIPTKAKRDAGKAAATATATAPVAAAATDDAEKPTAEATTEKATGEATTTEKPTTEATTEKPTTEATTEKATTEATTEKATTEATTEKATTEATTEKATTEATTAEKATAEATAEKATAEAPTMEATKEDATADTPVVAESSKISTTATTTTTVTTTTTKKEAVEKELKGDGLTTPEKKSKPEKKMNSAGKSYLQVIV